MALYDLIVESGVIVPDTSDILAETEQVYKTAYGEDFVTTPTSAQGQIVTAMAMVKSEVAKNSAGLLNLINPNMAGGVALDSIWALTGGKRVPLEYSTAIISCTGVAGTPILKDSEVEDDQGNIYKTTQQVTLVESAASLVWVKAVEPGPIQSAANTITKIKTKILGWDTATNPDAAIPGSFEQSDPSARTERNQTLALQSVKTMEAIFSRVRAVAGVNSLSARQNFEPTEQVIEGITIAANSVWTCVYGGEPADIFNALYDTQSPGQSWTGSETEIILDEWSKQPITVKFDRPTTRRLYVKCIVSSTSAVADPQAAVREALLAYAVGDTGTAPGFTVGSDVSSFELSGAITLEVPDMFIKLVQTSWDNTNWTSDPMSVEINEIATLQSGDIQTSTQV